MTTRPPTGLFSRLRFLWRRFRCPHSRRFTFFPGNVYSDLDNTTDMGSMYHGVKVLYCMDCGETWSEHYDE